jgi:hypothetical protein
LVQKSPNAHALPQVPQLAGSIAVFTQAVNPPNGQAVKGARHVRPASNGVPVQVPLVQNCPKAQVLPHAPQLVGSKSVSTQAVNPPNGQAVKGGRHVMPASNGVPVQVPLEQNCPNAHALPQAPQLVGSKSVFTQALVPSNGHEVNGGRHVMPASDTMLVQVPLEQN